MELQVTIVEKATKSIVESAIRPSFKDFDEPDKNQNYEYLIYGISIFLLIAGTYTLVLYYGLDGI